MLGLIARSVVDWGRHRSPWGYCKFPRWRAGGGPVWQRKLSNGRNLCLRSHGGRATLGGCPMKAGSARRRLCVTWEQREAQARCPLGVAAHARGDSGSAWWLKHRVVEWPWDSCS